MHTLWELCQAQYFPRRLQTGPQTRRQYRLALNDWARFLGREPELSDLTDDSLLLWMRDLMDRRDSRGRPLSPWTINERVGRVKTFWGWMFKRGKVSTFPTVPRLPVPDPTPRAWTKPQLGQLFAGADLEGGKIAGIPARLWWRARLAFHWFTPERKGAADQLRMEWVDLARGVCVIPATVRKGRRKAGVYDLPPALVEVLRAIWEPPRDLVFPWDRCEAVYWQRWNRILKNAGLPPGRRSKTQALRISHATWRKKMGDDPTKALQHSDPATTQRFYLDKTFDEQPGPLFDPWSEP